MSFEYVFKFNPLCPMRDIRPHIIKCCGLKKIILNRSSAISSENVGMCAVLERRFEHTHASVSHTEREC